MAFDKKKENTALKKANKELTEQLAALTAPQHTQE